MPIGPGPWTATRRLPARERPTCRPSARQRWPLQRHANASGCCARSSPGRRDAPGQGLRAAAPRPVIRRSWCSARRRPVTPRGGATVRAAQHQCSRECSPDPWLKDPVPDNRTAWGQTSRSVLMIRSLVPSAAARCRIQPPGVHCRFPGRSGRSSGPSPARARRSLEPARGFGARPDRQDKPKISHSCSRK